MLTTALDARAGLLCGNGAERCDGCPDINFNPPKDNDCPNFRMEGDTPVCEHPDGFERLRARMIGVPGVAAQAQLIEYVPPQPATTNLRMEQ